MNLDLEFDTTDYDDLRAARVRSQVRVYRELFGRIPPSLPVGGDHDDIIQELAGSGADE